MNMTLGPLHEFNELLSVLCDGQIREDQFQRLESLVIGDAELRLYYIRYMHMQGSLSRYVRIEPDGLAPLSFDAQPSVERVGVGAALDSETGSTQKVSADQLKSTQPGWPRRLITRYAVAAAIIVACFIIADRRSRHSLSGQAFAAALRQLSSAHVISYIAEFRRDGKIERISESMHLQPDRVREELPDGKIKVIDFSKRQSITIDPVRRTAVVVTDTNESPSYKPERFLDKMKECIERIRTEPLRTDRYLGERSVNGRIVEGFEMRKPTQVQTLWVDVETGLLTEMEIVAADDPGHSLVVRNVRFDVETYASFVTVDPPPGYEVSYETVGPTQPLDDKAKMIPR